MATPLTATPIPAYTAVPDVPADLTALANNLEKFAAPRFATTTARDAAITAPVENQLAAVTGVGIMRYNGSAWVLLDDFNQTARGVVYIGKTGSTSANVTAETVAYRGTGINLEAGRHYRVLYSQQTVDSDTGGTGTYASQGSAEVKLKIAAGSTAGTGSTQIAIMRMAVFGDDSNRAGGGAVVGTFTVASTTAYSIAVTIAVNGSAGNAVRFLGAGVLTVEDIGAAVTEQTVTSLI